MLFIYGGLKSSYFFDSLGIYVVVEYGIFDIGIKWRKYNDEIMNNGEIIEYTLSIIYV